MFSCFSANHHHHRTHPTQVTNLIAFDAGGSATAANDGVGATGMTSRERGLLKVTTKMIGGWSAGK